MTYCWPSWRGKDRRRQRSHTQQDNNGMVVDQSPCTGTLMAISILSKPSISGRGCRCRNIKHLGEVKNIHTKEFFISTGGRNNTQNISTQFTLNFFMSCFFLLLFHYFVYYFSQLYIWGQKLCWEVFIWVISANVYRENCLEVHLRKDGNIKSQAKSTFIYIPSMLKIFIVWSRSKV